MSLTRVSEDIIDVGSDLMIQDASERHGIKNFRIEVVFRAQFLEEEEAKFKMLIEIVCILNPL